MIFSDFPQLNHENMLRMQIWIAFNFSDWCLYSIVIINVLKYFQRTDILFYLFIGFLHSVHILSIFNIFTKAILD